MVRDPRSRRKLPSGAFCYLCGNPIAEGQEWNRDHVPPQRIFAKSIRQQYSPQLEWLPTHRECNTAHASDEDYFVTALAGHHRTAWARAVFEDIGRGVSKGKGIGRLKTILGQFGKITTADGSRLFELDTNRANRAIWKIVRGLYTLETDKYLPEDSFRRIEIVPRSEAEQVLPGHLWFRFVRDTEGMGRHKAMFDYKWLCRFVDDGHVDVMESRGNLIAMLLWDNLTLLCLFHDPACRCHRCRVEPQIPADPRVTPGVA
jgi:hypothetical protein